MVVKGAKLTPAAIALRTATRLARNGGVYQQARGWRHSEETRERMRQASRRNAKQGAANPFHGKHHTPEARARMGARGAANPQWRGGTGTLPYGPEFTRKFKQLLRERDNQTCQSCGKTRADVGKTLEVHHIDHRKENNNPTNLVTVCPSCNVWLSWHRDEPFVRFGRKT